MDTVKCPFCAEEIKSEAIKCRYCGSEIPKSSSADRVVYYRRNVSNSSLPWAPKVWKYEWVRAETEDIGKNQIRNNKKFRNVEFFQLEGLISAMTFSGWILAYRDSKAMVFKRQRKVFNLGEFIFLALLFVFPALLYLVWCAFRSGEESMTFPVS